MGTELMATLGGLLGGLAVFIYGMNLMSEGLQKAAGERMKQILGVLTRNRLIGVLAVFFHKVGSKANRIPEIVTHQSGHNGVQINDYQCLMRLLIKEDVVDLGIIVGNAHGQLSGVKQIGKLASFVFYRQQPFQFLPHFRHIAAGIDLHVRF